MFIAEEEELDFDEFDPELHASWATGRFAASLQTDEELLEEVEGVTAGEAVAWGRARSARVLIRLAEGDYFSAGDEELEDLPAWPPPDLPELVRRRVPSEEWKDRTPADAPIAWAVRAHLTPPDAFGMLERRPEDDAAVAALADRTGALSWDSDALDGCIEVFVEVARKRASSYTTYVPCAYTLHFQVEASTHAVAEAAVRERVSLPSPGWGIDVQARPPSP